MSQSGASLAEIQAAILTFRNKPGPHYTDARFLYRSVLSAASLCSYAEGSTTQNLATGGTFWNQVDAVGAQDQTVWTANTYKTILNITSGKGIFYNFLGPTGLAGTPTTTIEITVDGVVYTIAIVATSTTQRACLGALMNDGATAGSMFTTAKSAQGGSSTMDAGKTTQVIGAATYVPVPLPLAQMFGTLGLRFDTSLLVRAKSSESNSTTTNNECYSGVRYVVTA